MFFILPVKVFPFSLGLIYSLQPNRSWEWVPLVAHSFKGVSVQIHTAGTPAAPQEVRDVPRCPAPPREEPWGWGDPQDEALRDVPATPPRTGAYLEDASPFCSIFIHSLRVTGRGASGAGPSGSQPLVSLAAALGTLDFSLLYDQENNALHCTINKAKVRGADQPRGAIRGRRSPAESRG